MLDQNSFNINEPQRQSLLGVVVYIMRNFRVMLTLLLSYLAVAFQSFSVGLISTMILLTLALFFVVLAYYQYRNFTFHIEGDSLVIHRGVFVKDRLVVTVDRIQSIQITENLVQRVLGLVALKVDTAGSKGSELEIPALQRQIANALRDVLNEKKAEVTEEIEVEPIPKEVSKKTLVKLGLWDLIKVGLTENHLKTGMVAIAFVFGTISQYQEFLLEKYEAEVDEYALMAVNSGLKVVVLFLILYTVFSIGLSVVRTFLVFYGLKAELIDDTVNISTGLIKRNHFRIPKGKVQYIQWSVNPLRRAVGYESALLKPSSSMEEVAKKQRIEIPALRAETSQLLAEGVFGEYAVPNNELSANAMAYGRFTLVLSAIPAIALSIVSYFLVPSIAFVPALVWIVIGVCGYFYGRSVRLFYDEHFILITRGVIFKQRVIIPSYKMQSLSVQSNVFLRRRQLSHLKLYTAAGSKRIKYIDTKTANFLLNFGLLQVEKSTRSWM